MNEPPQKIEFTVSELSIPGTSNPITARTFIQTQKLLSSFRLVDSTKEDILSQMFKIVEKLSTCQKISKRINAEVSAISEKLVAEGKKNDGAVLQIPTVKDINEVEIFLYSIKHVYKILAKVIGIFVNCTYRRPLFIVR